MSDNRMEEITALKRNLHIYWVKHSNQTEEAWKALEAIAAEAINVGFINGLQEAQDNIGKVINGKPLT